MSSVNIWKKKGGGIQWLLGGHYVTEGVMEGKQQQDREKQEHKCEPKSGYLLQLKWEQTEPAAVLHRRGSARASDSGHPRF